MRQATERSEPARSLETPSTANNASIDLHFWLHLVRVIRAELYNIRLVKYSIEEQLPPSSVHVDVPCCRRRGARDQQSDDTGRCRRWLSLHAVLDQHMEKLTQALQPGPVAFLHACESLEQRRVRGVGPSTAR